MQGACWHLMTATTGFALRCAMQCRTVCHAQVHNIQGIDLYATLTAATASSLSIRRYLNGSKAAAYFEPGLCSLCRANWSSAPSLMF